MNILVIRHGQSEADILQVHEGRVDYPLTEKGHKQAQIMADFIKSNFKVNKIYSSTLTRAKQTAQYLADIFNLDIIYEEDLQEFNNGLLAGLTYEEAKIKYPKVDNLPIDKSVYGMESLLEFRNRAERVLNKILEETKDDETIVIISHGKMINQLYHVFLNLPVNQDIFFSTGDTGIHLWLKEKERRYVVFANYNPVRE
ncbi:MAG: histidine phosphatase family protein [Bacilli bacterium]|nr:histidine phosphatase family protein [Bacilli bacterium]